jgi:hypothetical protein
MCGHGVHALHQNKIFPVLFCSTTIATHQFENTSLQVSVGVKRISFRIVIILKLRFFAYLINFRRSLEIIKWQLYREI